MLQKRRNNDMTILVRLKSETVVSITPYIPKTGWVRTMLG